MLPPLALLPYTAGLKKMYSGIMFPLFICPVHLSIFHDMSFCSCITSTFFCIIGFCSCTMLVWPCSMLVCSYSMVPEQELSLLTALQANGVLCIMYISLCFMVICSYSMALYSSITPAFSCTLSVYSKMIAFNLMPLVCLSVHHSQMLSLLVWLFMHLIV